MLIDYELGIKNFKVPKEHFLVNKNLSELDLKERFGLNILMIKRDDQVISAINGKTLIQEDDLLVLTGSKNRINDDLTKLLAS